MTVTQLSPFVYGVYITGISPTHLEHQCRYFFFFLIYIYTHRVAKFIIFLLYHRVFPSAYIEKTMSCA